MCAARAAPSGSLCSCAWRTSRSRTYATSAARDCDRCCQSRSSGTVVASPSAAPSRSPSQARRVPYASDHSPAASSECHVGTWMPLVTCPTGTSPTGQPGNSEANSRRLTCAVQARDAVDVPAAVHGEVRHVERLGTIGRVATAQRQERFGGDARLLDQRPRVVEDEVRVEPVEGRLDGRVRREHVAGPGGSQGRLERQPVPASEARRPRDDGERGVTLVQVAYPRLDPELLEQAVPADPEHQLLQQALLAPRRVQVRRDAAVPGAVERVVAVEEVEADRAHAHLPDAQEERPTRAAPGGSAASARPRRGPAAPAASPGR